MGFDSLTKGHNVLCSGSHKSIKQHINYMCFLCFDGVIIRTSPSELNKQASITCRAYEWRLNYLTACHTINIYLCLDGRLLLVHCALWELQSTNVISSVKTFIIQGGDAGIGLVLMYPGFQLSLFR